MNSPSTRGVTVGIVDDHQLFVKSLGLLINTFAGFEVVVDAYDGDQLLARLDRMEAPPDILLVDVNMPERDGTATTRVIVEKYPNTRIIALSMNDDDLSIIGMIRAGCCAYLLKGIHPAELERALLEVSRSGSYNGDTYNINYRRLAQTAARQGALQITEREARFLQLACSEMTYKEIAAQMYVSDRTVDGYRESVFEKLKVQSRVGMVLEALRLKLVKTDR